MIKPGDRIRLTDYAAKAFNKNMRRVWLTGASAAAWCNG
mgnify:CR=1 FL=1